MFCLFIAICTSLGLAIVGAGPTVCAAPLYSIRPLEVPAGHHDVFARGINNHGQIVGFTVDVEGYSHAVRWDENGVHPLPTLSATLPVAEAYRINDAGQIAGKATLDDGSIHAAFWDSTGITDIGTLPGGRLSFAQALNEDGVVVGSSEAERGQHAFTWTPDGGLVDYGNLDPDSNLSVAGFNGINNQGLMVGTGYRLLSPYNAILAREGDRQPTNISPAGQFSTGMALAVNDAGTIVGYQNALSGSPEAAIFRGDGTYEPLGRLGLDETWALDINEAGVIVGRGFGSDENGSVQQAFVYQHGEMTELLRSLTDSSGWNVLFDAAAINDRGVIVGVGEYNGEVRGYVATPVPEPHSVLLTVAALGLVRRRRPIRVRPSRIRSCEQERCQPWGS
jgi:probable HAF family extracellular repeat protein